jgi:hypothetical protein
MLHPLNTRNASERHESNRSIIDWRTPFSSIPMTPSELDRAADQCLSEGRVHTAERLAWQAAAMRGGL